MQFNTTTNYKLLSKKQLQSTKSSNPRPYTLDSLQVKQTRHCIWSRCGNWHQMKFRVVFSDFTKQKNTLNRELGTK